MSEIKDDFQVVSKFPRFLGHHVYLKQKWTKISKENLLKMDINKLFVSKWHFIIINLCDKDKTKSFHLTFK